MAYFHRDLLRLARAVGIADQRLAWLLLLSAVPGAIAGAVLEDVIDKHLGQIALIAVMLIVFGLVLAAADSGPGEREEHEFGRREAVIVGLAQAWPSPPACRVRASP